MGWLLDLIARLFGLFINRKPVAVAEAERLGAAQAQVANVTAQAKAEAAVAAAAVQAPDSADKVADRMAEGSF